MTNAMTRRQAISRGLAGVTVLVAGGAVWRAWSNGVFQVGEGPAYQPWHDWRDGKLNGPMAVVQAGILASNAHNTQPWRFAVADDRIALFADHGRHLGTFDPYRREMVLSLGCALENMRLAAQAQGFEPQIELAEGHLTLGSPPAAGEPVAVLHLSKGARRESELFQAIAQRHTNRGEYDADQPPPPTLLEDMQALAGDFAGVRLLMFGEGEQRARLGELTVAATADIIADHQMAMDSARWFRFNWKSVQQHRDGVTLDAVGLRSLINAVAKIIPASTPEEADRQWLAATRDVHVKTAPVLGLIAVRDLYDRPKAVEAGRLWQRMHLWATARGLAAQPLNQIPERVDREAELDRPSQMAKAAAAIIGEPGWRPTFVFRMGYAKREARLSPRRSIDAVLAS